MKTKSRTTSYIVHSIAAVVLLLTAQVSLAGSATWLSSPQDSAWENPNNWTAGGPPNGSSDIATFGPSSQNQVNVSASVEVNSIVFTSGASSFNIGVSPSQLGVGGELTFSGTGIVDNSSVSQGLAAGNGGRIIFKNTSTAGHVTIFNGFGEFGGGETIFNDSSTAGSAFLIANGGCYEAASGDVVFNDRSTGGTARIEAFYGCSENSGSGYLYIGNHQSGMSIGSIEGIGYVYLGANNLRVGTNNRSTSFDGTISGGQGSSLTKVGSGILTLSATFGLGIYDTVGLSLVSGSPIKLNFVDPEVIAFLKVNGVSQPPGVYGGPMSGAPHIVPEFRGTGTVSVGAATPPSPPIANPARYIASNSFTANWSSVSGATGYRLDVSTNSSFSTYVAGYQTRNVGNATSRSVTGLNASTTYYYRVRAYNGAGTSGNSNVISVTTLGPMGPPVVITNLATLIASFSVTLNGSVDPHHLPTTVYFQYGTTTGYGLTTAIQSKTGNTYQNVAANISGLTANTTYHFRIVATNSAGTRYGSDTIFTTLRATGPPVVITNPATYIASFSARLDGTVDPHGLTTTVYFQYGTTTGYGLTTAIQSKTGNTYQNVAANISGLTTSTTYHFRVVATNSAGTRYGSDRTFTTAP